MRPFIFLLLGFNLLHSTPRVIEQNNILELEFLSSLEIENPFADITLELDNPSCPDSAGLAIEFGNA